MPTPSLQAGLSQLIEPASIALAQSIQQAAIATPLSPEAIATTYVRQGTGGTPLLLLHGFDSSVLEFRRLLPKLAERHETWAVDLLGFGFTARPARLALSPDAIKTHLYYVWKTLIAQPMVLVGASMGGAAAIDFALTYPQAVKALVLIDSAGFTVGPALGKYLFPPLGYFATSFLASPKVRQSISEKAYHDPSFASLDARLCTSLHLNESGWQQALISFTQSGGYPSFKPKLAQLETQTLILWGESDRILGTADATRFEQAIAHSQLIWIKHCGHVPHLEQSQTTADHILEFIQRIA
ncbi:MAG TPA: alpha/beta hydrolase [Crinalium sp.]|jgi:pimeloyl-ACP methyl ester carboxylesterase